MMQKVRTWVVLPIILISLNACTPTPQVIYQIPTIELPAPNEVPKVSMVVVNNKLCMDEVNAKALYMRDKLRAEEAQTLRSLIEAVNRQFGAPTNE